MTDGEFLQWLHRRLVEVYKEPATDFVRRLEALADRMIRDERFIDSALEAYDKSLSDPAGDSQVHGVLPGAEPGRSDADAGAGK